MLNLSTIKKAFCLFAFFVIVSCSKSGDDTTPQITTPSNLSYSPSSQSVVQGTAVSSAKPIISGSSPISYSIITTPSTNAITIDADGTIKAGTNLATGTYSISVTATNSAGSVKFDNAYTITVNAATPQSLSYSPNTATVTTGTSVTSAVPSISSSTAVTYTFTSSPASNAISINNQGVISSTTSLSAGVYNISVTATNAAGSNTFNNAYKITVNAPGTNAVSFNADVKGIFQTNCSACHAWTDYNTAKASIDLIITRINLPQGNASMMPQGGTRLPQATRDLIQKWKDDGLKE